MGANPHYIHPTSDEFIVAAGFDPTIHPEFVSVEEFVHSKHPYIDHNDAYYVGVIEVLDQLDEAGFATLTRQYTIAERLELYGAKIVGHSGGSIGWTEGGYDYEPRTIKLSNGLTLREVRDAQKEEAFWKSDEGKTYTAGYDFVSVFRVEVIKC